MVLIDYRCRATNSYSHKLPAIISCCIQSTFSGSISFWNLIWWALTLFFLTFRGKLRLLSCDLFKMIQWGRSALNTLFLIPSLAHCRRMWSVAGLCSLQCWCSWLSSSCPALEHTSYHRESVNWDQWRCVDSQRRPSSFKSLLCTVRWQDVHASGVPKGAEPSNRNHLNQQVNTRVLLYVWCSGEY